jgi:hypothetical protein
LVGDELSITEDIVLRGNRNPTSSNYPGTWRSRRYNKMQTTNTFQIVVAQDG